MRLPVDEIITMLIDNIVKRNSPIPISENVAHGWAEEIDIPRGGDTILYTGQLYQLVPYIDSLVTYIEKFSEKNRMLLKIGVYLNKMFNITRFAARPPKDDIIRQNNVLKNIATLLKAFGVEYGYLYEDELYSGVLLYDLGVDDVFAKHAKKVYGIFRKYNIKKIITVDPHTTHILRSVYPKFIQDFDIEVKSYLEVLYNIHIKPKKKINKKFVIHDPCFYARYENIIMPQRRLLEKAGIKILEPERTRELTFCCGGPIESLSPSMSKKIAVSRLNQLTTKSNNVIVMCPLCYANLKRVTKENINLIDISQLLYEAYVASEK